MTMPLAVRALRPDERGWADALLDERWGATRVVSVNRVHDASTLPSLVAIGPDNRPAGLATYTIVGNESELVTIDAVPEGAGAGTALLAAVVTAARTAGCRRLWLVTTNDNVRALRFYQRRGLRLAALHRDAVTTARGHKPSIPETGEHGIPLRDMLELELVLRECADAARPRAVSVPAGPTSPVAGGPQDWRLGQETPAGLSPGRPAAARSMSALSVRSHVKSASSRPKWP